MGFPGSSDSKESDCDMGDPDSIPGSGRSPGEGSGYPLKYSCLENSWTEDFPQSQIQNSEKSYSSACVS